MQLKKNPICLLFVVWLNFSFGQRNKPVYDGSCIQFHLYGKGEPVFVLSGGPGNNCRQLEEVAIKLGEQFQAILLEQRGTGLSMPKELNASTINLTTYLQDIVYVMDSLKIKKAKFVGHSWGGPYALAFALVYPEKVTSIVCVGPGYLKFDNKANKKLYELRMAKLSESDRKLYKLLARKKYSDLSTTEVKKFADLRCIVNLSDTTNLSWKLSKIQRSNPSDRTNELMMKDLEKTDFDLAPKLKSLTMPISIIIGKDDPISFLIPDYKKSAPQAEILWLSQTGHYPMYERPDEFYATLMQALKR